MAGCLSRRQFHHSSRWAWQIVHEFLASYLPLCNLYWHIRGLDGSPRDHGSVRFAFSNFRSGDLDNLWLIRHYKRYWWEQRGRGDREQSKVPYARDGQTYERYEDRIRNGRWSIEVCQFRSLSSLCLKDGEKALASSRELSLFRYLLLYPSSFSYSDRPFFLSPFNVVARLSFLNIIFLPPSRPRSFFSSSVFSQPSSPLSPTSIDHDTPFLFFAASSLPPKVSHGTRNFSSTTNTQPFDYHRVRSAPRKSTREGYVQHTRVILVELLRRDDPSIRIDGRAGPPIESQSNISFSLPPRRSSAESCFVPIHDLRGATLACASFPPRRASSRILGLGRILLVTPWVVTSQPTIPVARWRDTTAPGTLDATRRSKRRPETIVDPCLAGVWPGGEPVAMFSCNSTWNDHWFEWSVPPHCTEVVSLLESKLAEVLSDGWLYWLDLYFMFRYCVRMNFVDSWEESNGGGKDMVRLEMRLLNFTIIGHY